MTAHINTDAATTNHQYNNNVSSISRNSSSSNSALYRESPHVMLSDKYAALSAASTDYSINQSSRAAMSRSMNDSDNSRGIGLDSRKRLSAHVPLQGSGQAVQDTDLYRKSVTTSRYA